MDGDFLFNSWAVHSDFACIRCGFNGHLERTVGHRLVRERHAGRVDANGRGDEFNAECFVLIVERVNGHGDTFVVDKANNRLTCKAE